MARFDITVAGELNIDLILYGVPEELPRERELLASNMIFTLGASSAIVAHNIAALGRKVGFQTRIGDDQLGQMALERLQQGGVDVSQVRRVPGVTKTGLSVLLQRETWRTIVTYSGTIAKFCWDDLDLDYLADARHFHLSSFYLQDDLRPRVGELFQYLKSKGLTISLDTNDDPLDQWQGGLHKVLPYVDVFLPNEREACRVTDTEEPEQAIEKLAKLVPIVAVKLGRKGAMAQQGSQRFTSSGQVVDAVDAIGAGDSFDAGFIDRYLSGADLSTCLAGGNLAGAFSTTRPGGTEAFCDVEYRTRFFRERGGMIPFAKK